MKKLFVFILAVLFIVIFSSCGVEPGMEEPLSSEDFSSEEPPEKIQTGPTEEEILDLLHYQICLYEIGNYGFPIETEGGYSNWMFAAVYSDAIGATDDDAGRRQPLIRLMYDRWLGVQYDGYFSYVSPAEARMIIEIKEYEFIDDTVRVVVSRIRNGIELTDSEYIFLRKEADEELLASEAADLTLGGCYWKYESVTPLTAVADPEVITLSAPEDLIEFTERVNSRDNAAVTAKVILANDIDMTGYEVESIGVPYGEETFDPSLCYMKTPGSFSGEFDGAGHTISGINIVQNDEDSYIFGIGFFSQIGRGAYIHDLTVAGSVLEGEDSIFYFNGSVGGFAGSIADGARVENCRFEGTVNGYSSVGGFAGNIGGDYLGSWISAPAAVVTGCSSSADITATYQSGGFAGYISSPVYDCEAVGTLTVVEKDTRPNVIGGFVGGLLCDLDNCRAAVDIIYDVPEPDWMGNFAGELVWEITISNSKVDTDNMREGWRLIGIRHYKNCTIDIAKEDWYSEAE